MWLKPVLFGFLKFKVLKSDCKLSEKEKGYSETSMVSNYRRGFEKSGVTFGPDNHSFVCFGSFSCFAHIFMASILVSCLS